MIKKIASMIVGVSLSFAAYSGNLQLSNTPLYLGGNVEPNIMFTMDDSGSMQWEIMPDENITYAVYLFPMPADLYGGPTYNSNQINFDDDNVLNFYSRSSHNNGVFYNPDVEYLPWSTSVGSSMGSANPSAALYNPTDPTRGSLNLVTQQVSNQCWAKSTSLLTNAFGAPCFGNHSFWPITYYVYTGPDGGNVLSRGNYQRTQITTATPISATFTSPNGTIRTRNEERQNFANWFQYYRSRVLASRAGVGRAFGKQSTNIRVGYAAINKGFSTIDGVSTSVIARGVRQFDGADRDDFFDRLYNGTVNGSTPLVESIDRVGKYFKRQDNRGPWGKLPGVNDSSGHLACRQSYNILMTDGYWNGSFTGADNADNTAGALITSPTAQSFQYSPGPPYSDSWSNTLADFAMKYWKEDLRTDLDNEVPVSGGDDAFWQHLTNFTVGLGVSGTLLPSDKAGLDSGAIAWPNPLAGNAEKIDDMWHAAINSRGSFFSAADSDTFSNALSNVLAEISSRTSSASSVALNSGSISSDSRVYQAKFNSGDWTGQLISYGISSDGAISAPLSDSAQLIPRANNRIILTSRGNNGKKFRWGQLSASQKADLGSKDVLSYLRGNSKNEVINGGTFRTRSVKLGDIIHSNPIFVGPPSQRYPNDWGVGSAEPTGSYNAFKADKASRNPLVYVGANDGMLHAFDASNGVEKFAFIPSSIFPRLKNLASQDYSHEYFVDESPLASDAFFNGQWNTILVSGLRSGGQSIFAIDITDTNAYTSENNASGAFLWEFTDDDDSDLGYTFGKPSLVRLQNGRWGVVVSGGYNNTYDDDGDLSSANDSTTGDAVLFILDAETGAVIKKFNTQVGQSEDPSGLFRPNGLSTPSVIDIDGDFTADVIYAGDLFGNVWKMNIASADPDLWTFSHGSTATPEPLFTACSGNTCNGSNVQRITTQIQVSRHPINPGYMLYFGTGSYFEVGENNPVNETTQTVYGVWDDGVNNGYSRSQMLKQEITKEVAVNGSNYRLTSSNSISWLTHKGWYMDLINTDGGNTDNRGERQISNILVRNGRVIFTTLIPSSNACDFGGTGFIMEVDERSGSRLDYSSFDVNSDGVFNRKDFFNAGDLDGDGIDDWIPSSGKESGVGIIPTPTIATSPDGNKEYKITNGSSGSLEVTTENPGKNANGRQSWRDLSFK